MKNLYRKFFTSIFLMVTAFASVHSQEIIANVEGRHYLSLNGKWQTIIDPFNQGAGNWKPIWKDQTPVSKTDFYEYKFDSTVTLSVPGDWNSQNRELKYYEGTVWYKKTITFKKTNNKKIQEHAKQKQNAQNQSNSSFNILLIDDDKDVLFTFESIIRNEGYNVTSYSDSNKALDHLSSLDPYYYDLMLCRITKFKE